MTNDNDARRAHDVLDGLFSGRILSRENEQLLRSFLPELPKQKTLEELIEHVNDVWGDTHVNEWDAGAHGVLEGWLSEFEVQLRGLVDAEPEIISATVPALPAGMRIAVHAVYGRVVVSPVVDDDGTCKIFHLSTHARDGSDYCWAPIDSLTFIDYEPAKPARPEFLETEADYQDAPEGTIVACEDSTPWYKFDSVWLSANTCGSNNAKGMAGVIRSVLRWGNE